MQGFDIYFLGEMLPEADPMAVRTKVARLFKLEPSAADRLFSGKPIRVKQGVDVDAASKYRAAFREAGALVQIVAEGSPPPKVAAPPAPATAAPATTTEAPASEPEPLPLPEVSEDDEGFSLAEPGATIDHTPPAAPADIDTGDLEALPPNTGSLEDCRADKPPRPIPDISHMKLVDD